MERKVDAQYATISLLLWNATKRVFTIAAAGTLPPLICRRGVILDVSVAGVPIGLLDDREYEQIEVQAEAGDLILLYSDGVEDQLADDREYGRERLEKILHANCLASTGDLPKLIFSDVDRFRGGTPLTDDQSVIAMRVL